MASCTLQAWSGEEAGAPYCPAGPTCLTRSGCFGTTSGFPSLNWHAANGCIHVSTQSTTHSSAQHTSRFRSLDEQLSPVGCAGIDRSQKDLRQERSLLI